MPGQVAEELCLYVKSPSPDCYCINMNSAKIELAVRFCMGDFRKCPHFCELQAIAPGKNLQ